MKLLFIKAGKALATIKREGMLKGGKRVLKAFFALFNRVKPADVLFITGGVGDSARYRVIHMVEELELNGISASYTIQDNPFLPTYVDTFKVFVFHRVLYTPSVKNMIEKIKKQNKEIIFETDDLVYDPKFLVHMDYFKQINAMERKLYENGVGGEILKDPYVKVCTTSTNYLAKKLEEEGKKVIIIPNKLSNEEVGYANLALGKSSLEAETGTIKIGYFSGTISHNKDFETITDVLLKLMGKYSNIELYLVGPLDINSKLNKFKERIKQFPFVTLEKHFQNIASVQINVAPLEIENPFCQAKSELKFFEAGIVKVPSVVAGTEPFKNAIVDGVDGFIASSSKEWEDKLEKLILDRDLRKDMGEKAYQTAIGRYTNANAKSEEYYQYLKNAINRISEK